MPKHLICLVHTFRSNSQLAESDGQSQRYSVARMSLPRAAATTGPPGPPGPSDPIRLLEPLLYLSTGTHCAMMGCRTGTYVPPLSLPKSPSRSTLETPKHFSEL